jgi:hypothetical protein
MTEDNDNGKEDEKLFPKSYVCPNPKCGSHRLLTQMAVSPLKSSGRLPLDAMRCMEVKYTPLLDPKDCKFVMPAMFTYYDACYDCGTYYIFKAEIKDVPLAPQMTPPPGKGNFPKFNL